MDEIKIPFTGYDTHVLTILAFQFYNKQIKQIGTEHLHERL